MALTLRRNKKTNDVGSIDEKIRIKSVESIDVTVLIGSAIAAFALVQLLYQTTMKPNAPESGRKVSYKS